MKKRVLGFIPLLILTLCSIPAWSQHTTAPEIYFKEKAYVADEVIEGTHIEHTFVVYNRGNAVLRIEKVKPG